MVFFSLLYLHGNEVMLCKILSGIGCCCRMSFMCKIRISCFAFCSNPK